MDVKPGWCGITPIKSHCLGNPIEASIEDASKAGAEERAQDMQARHLQTQWKTTKIYCVSGNVGGESILARSLAVEAQNAKLNSSNI